jgi:NAD(P)-dependent dehydrogenase (short-subunit alcohol dehydrogenase family)
MQLEKDMVDQFKTNAVANIHLFNLFIPLVLKGNVKKVIAISSGMADTELVRKYGIYESACYAVSKASLNMIVAKFQAEYTKDGVLFLAICPGFVNTGLYDNSMSFQDPLLFFGPLVLHWNHANPVSVPEEEGAKVMAMTQKFKAYAPHIKGQAEPEESVKHVLAVVDKVSLQNGDGGNFLSHKGNKQWV